MKKIRRSYLSILMIFALLISLVSLISRPEKVEAASGDTLKVGFFTDMPYFMTENEKTKMHSGYGIEYLQTVGNITGWEFEYVYGEWSELWKQLNNGEIDILMDVSYSEERAEQMLFPDYAMGHEIYRLYVDSRDSDITEMDLFTSLKGKRIGVTADTIQEKLLQEWVTSHGYDCEIVSYRSDFERNDDLETDVLDGVVELEASSLTSWEPIISIGESDYYMVLSKGNEGHLEELNKALTALDSVSPQYNDDLFYKYYSNEIISSRLGYMEQDWADSHDEIRVGYLVEGENGYTKSLLTDLINEILTALHMDQYHVTVNGYTDYDMMKTALQNGTIDLMYPVFNDPGIGEQENVAILTTIETIYVSAIWKTGTDWTQSNTIAVQSGDILDYYIESYYSNYTIIHCFSDRECLNAVKNGRADMALTNTNSTLDLVVSSPAYDELEISNGGSIYQKCLATSKHNEGLYVIMLRGLNLVDYDYMRILNAKYDRKENPMNLITYLKKNLEMVLGVLLIVVILVFVWIVGNSRRRTKKLLHLSETDTLTGITNRVGEKKIKNLMDAGAEGLFILFDVDHFKEINDQYGHDVGDKVLVKLAQCLKENFRDGDVVLRLGGDEFAAFTSNVLSEETARMILQRFLKSISEIEIPELAGQKISISLGACFHSVADGQSFEEIYKYADHACYESKKIPGSHFTIYKR